MFRTYRKLSNLGVLGINRRNAEYILKYNPRSFYPLVDNKLETKRIALQANMSVPELYGVVTSQRQVRSLPEILRRFGDFVIKPAHGSGGDGILVVSGHTDKRFRKISGELIDDDEVKFHVANILSGMYSLGGHPDEAIIEYRIQFDSIFAKVSYQGVPDIRIIVLLGVPVMAMVRLPTKMSDGKANLHQGAVGVGVNIATGMTTTGVIQNEIIDEHPDNENQIAGIKIPGWRNLLKLAAESYELTGLGYVGVDIALDETRGPLILEMNARPGLNIQIANQTPLLPRLRLVEKERNRLSTLAMRVNFAQNVFNSKRLYHNEYP